MLKHPDGVYKLQVVQTFWSVCMAMSLYEFYKILNVFNCIDYDGEKVMIEDLSVVCHTEEHYIHAIPAGIAGLFWMVLVPILRFYLMITDTKKIKLLVGSGWRTDGLTEDQIDECYWTNVQYSASFAGYSPKRYFWDSLQLF